MPECTARSALRILAGLVVSFTLALLLLSTGCRREEPAKPPEQPRMSDPITEEDFLKMRNALQQAIAERNRSRIIALFSKSGMFDLVFEDVKIEPSARRDLESGINRGGNLAAVISRIFDGLNESGEYEFVRRIDEGDRTWMLFRFDLPAAKEIDYHRYELVRGYKAKVLIRDVDFYLDRESLVQRIRQGVLVALQAAGKLVSESGADLSRELPLRLVESDDYLKYLELAAAGNWQDAWVAFDRLPQEVRNNRQSVYQRIIIAQKLGVIYVTQAIKEARDLFPESLQTEFQAYEYYRQIPDEQQALEAVDRLRAIVDDPYLELLRIDPLVRTGRVAEAKGVMQKHDSFKGTDTNRVLLSRFEIANAEKDFGTCLKVLETLEKGKRLTIDNLSKLPRYAEFLKSPEYERWQRGQDR